MDGSIYLLSRKVTGDVGEAYTQNVTVFATSAEKARALVEEQFARLRRLTGTRGHAYQTLPEFRVDKVALDQHKVITAGVTV